MPKDLNINGDTYADVERVAASTTTGEQALYTETPTAPSILISSIPGGHCVTFVDANGEHSFNVMNGHNGGTGPIGPRGTPGTPGISPTVEVNDIVGGHRVSITDANGTKFFDVLNGSGSNGDDSINTVVPHIGVNGNWFVGNTDTGVPATGPRGEQGEQGGSSNVVAVEISQLDAASWEMLEYSVFLNGEPVTGAALDEMYRTGAVIYGFLNGYMDLYNAEGIRMGVSISGEVFQYRAADVPGRSFTDWPPFMFHTYYRGRDIMIAYVDDKWVSKSKPKHTVVELDVDYLTKAPLIYINDECINKAPYYDPVYLKNYIMSSIRHSDTIICRQLGMSFSLPDGTTVVPPLYTPFSVRFTDAYEPYFYAEQDGYIYSVTNEYPNGFVAKAEKTRAYKAAESKADNLEVDDGSLFLLSGTERISDGIPISGGVNFTTDGTLTLDPTTKVLSVNTADAPDANNTLPITAAAVHTTVGNIEVLLETI